MADLFDALDGCRLDLVFDELEGRSADWDIAEPRPDGSVSFGRLVEAMVAGDAAPRPPNSEQLLALMRGLEAGELRVEADGDHTNGYQPLVIPPGFWRQRRSERFWRLRRDTDGARLEVWVSPNKQPVAVHDNPRVVVPVAGVIAPPNNDPPPEPPDPREARGVELYRQCRNYVQAAAALYDELHPKPAERNLMESWETRRSQFKNTWRTRIRKAKQTERPS